MLKSFPDVQCDQKKSTNPNHSLKNLEDAVASLLSEIRELSNNQNVNNQRTERLEATLDLILEGHPSAPNLWLTPKELGKLVGLSSSSVSKYRHAGLFGKLSVKEVKRGNTVEPHIQRIDLNLLSNCICCFILYFFRRTW